LAGLAKQNDPEFQARVKKEQDEWENKVRYEAPENPMIWYDYYTWANKNVFNSYQLKVSFYFIYLSHWSNSLLVLKFSFRFCSTKL